MKSFFGKKNSKNDDFDDFNEGYDNDYYSGALKTEPDASFANIDEVHPVSANSGVTPVSDTAFTPVANVVSPVRPVNEQPVKNTAVKPTVKCFAPASRLDSAKIVNCMKDGAIVLLNVTKLSREEFTRLFDYIMGGAQALEYNMDKIGKANVVISPKNADVSEIIAMASLKRNEEKSQTAEQPESEDNYDEEGYEEEEEYNEEYDETDESDTGYEDEEYSDGEEYEDEYSEDEEYADGEDEYSDEDNGEEYDEEYDGDDDNTDDIDDDEPQLIDEENEE